MGFYVMSVVVSFGIALAVAFFQNKELSFDDKISLCAKAIGDDNIVIMLLIFLMAGAFSGLASQAGGAASTASLMLSVIPASLAVPGLFIIACLISMAMGTSVGTITVLIPIALEIVKSTTFSIPFLIGTVVGGAMFGDNLSFISDTTIAATRTQGVQMADKFKTNIRIALPSAVITLVILSVYTFLHPGAKMASYEYNILLSLPYFIVFFMALKGMNVFKVLGIGIILFFLIGLFSHTLTISTAFSAMSSGTSGMFETMVVTILVASISALMKAYGGFQAILEFITSHAKGKRAGMLGIFLLTGMMDIACANNTVAIIIAAPIAKEIAEQYNIDPRKTASLLDTSSCIFQAIIPYGAQLLIASSLSGISPVSIMPFLIYPYFLAIATIISMAKE